MKKIPKKYKKRKERKGDGTEGSLFLKRMLGTLLLTLAVGGGVLLLSALILTFVPDPLSLALPVGLLCAAMTALAGGFFATRVYHLSALGAGLINGILITALSLLFSLFFAKNANCYATGYSATVSALLHAGAVGLSIGGAFLGAHEKTPAKRRKKVRR